MKAIASYAFTGNAKEIVIPSSVQKVKSTTFFSDTVTKITFNGKISLDGGGTPFTGATNTLKEVFVPLECIDYYNNTAGWKNFSSLYKLL